MLTAPTALHPVDVVWCPPARPTPPAYGLRVDPVFLDHVAATVRRALTERTGDVLVFLPGAGEIGTVTGRLADLRSDVDLVALHGRQPAKAQDDALRPGPRRRVVLASAVAESSLTVPGVRIVVDAGLSRVPRTDLARGLGSLVTVRVSRASAEQRAGRAGREAPGTVYRCWSAADHDRLPAHAEPEVAVADLTGFALELACWGDPDGAGLALLDPPPAAAMEVARATLRALGAVDADGRVTARGRSIAAVGAHPRLARALRDGAALVGARRAAEVVALLSDDGLVRQRGRPGQGVAATAGRRRPGRHARAGARRSAGSARAWTAPAPGGPPTTVPGGFPTTWRPGWWSGWRIPERLARARRTGGGSYLMTGGTAAELAPGSSLAGAAWLAVAVADRAPGKASARVRLAAALDEPTAREAAPDLLSQRGRRSPGWTATWSPGGSSGWARSCSPNVR